MAENTVKQQMKSYWHNRAFIKRFNILSVLYGLFSPTPNILIKPYKHRKLE